jgi:hypothetical protein
MLPHVSGYRIPVPWTWAAVSGCVGENCWMDVVISSKGTGRFGITPFWPTQQLSMATFEKLVAKNYEPDWKPTSSPASRFDLKFRDQSLTCWKYPSQDDLYDRQLIGLPADVTAWSALCSNGSFQAYFFGREQDLSAFFGVLERVSLIN